MKHPNIAIFKALAVEPRAKIVALLYNRCLCAGALARKLDLTPGAVSQHLTVLKACGLVTFERRGYFMHYRITDDAHERARKALDALFVQAGNLPKGSGRCTGMCSCPQHKDHADNKPPSSQRKERLHV